MSKLITVIALFVASIALGQQPVKELKPSRTRALDFSAEGAARFKADLELFQKVSEKVSRGFKPENLTGDERRVWNDMDETTENYWDVVGGGCSWYCGGGSKEETASSHLAKQGANTYDASNAHDLNYQTAWVEGAPGLGIGEFLLYQFTPESPRITSILVVNGYVKSDRAYLDNARVKKLKVYFNDKPLAILLLNDQRSVQRFDFEPIGNSNRKDYEALKLQPRWTLKFEILEVYKGLKYDDVAITEIYFDGVDVH